MNCQEILERVEMLVAHPLSETEKRSCEEHLNGCDECQSALRGTEALHLIRNQRDMAPPNGLFEKVLRHTTGPKHQLERRNRFWLGAGFGGAIAASLLALALTFGSFGPMADRAPAVAEFTIALNEPRYMDIAIEIDHALVGANISILLSGGVELDGYGDRRELSWTTDLVAGVNRLRLPVLAIDLTGGQMVVRLYHPDSEQMFVVQLKTKA